MTKKFFAIVGIVLLGFVVQAYGQGVFGSFSKATKASRTGVSQVKRQAERGARIGAVVSKGLRNSKISESHRYPNSVSRQSLSVPRLPGLRLRGPVNVVNRFHIPKIESLSERMDRLMAEDYAKAKRSVEVGKLDSLPGELFRWADYASRKGDTEFVEVCLMHAVSEYTTPSVLNLIPQHYPALSSYLPSLTEAIVANGYLRGINRTRTGSDNDSTRVEGGDIMLDISDNYIPTLKPLIELCYFSNPSDEPRLYMAVADSLIDGKMNMDESFQEVFYEDMLLTLCNAGEYKAALDYFCKEPLKLYTDSVAPLQLTLCDCALEVPDDDQFRYYLEKANAIDSLETQQYMQTLYNERVQQFIDNPARTDIGKWLINYDENPAEAILLMSLELFEKYFSGTCKWDWINTDIFTPQQHAAYQAINTIIAYGPEVANFTSTESDTLQLELLKIKMAFMDEEKSGYARESLETLLHRLNSVQLQNVDDFRCHALIMQAYQAGHGLDEPKKALKILKKNIKLFDRETVKSATQSACYGYMSALYFKLGKSKEAARYGSLQTDILHRNQTPD